MADFEIALARTLRFEGGYANNPNDTGGETYRGIARKFHSTWPGWQIIDSAKSNPAFPASLEANPLLGSFVADFYRAEFWNVLCAGDIHSQEIANELFDAAVNHGIAPAVRILQQAMNYLTAPPLLFLTVDGAIGPATINAVNRWLTSSSLEFLVATNSLLSVMLVLRAKLYVRIIDGKASQKVFFEGWIRRILGPPALVERGV